MRNHLLILGLLLPALAVGCSTRKQTDLLEARLRDQEAQIADLSSQLKKARTEIDVAQRQSNDLRQQLAARGDTVIQPEQADVLYRLAGVRIDQMQSAILPTSNQSEQVLNSLITPVDQYGQPLRYPADMKIVVTADKKQIAAFDVAANEIAPKWTCGWLASGYTLQFPLKTSKMQGEEIEIEVILKSVDGREFKDQLRIGVPPTASQVIPASGTLHQGENQPPPEPKVPNPPEEMRPSTNVDPYPSKFLGGVETSDRRTIEEFPVYR